MLDFILSPLASWFGTTVPIFLLATIALFVILNFFRG